MWSLSWQDGDDDDEDWAEDTTEEAQRRRMEEISEHAKGLTLSEDLEKSLEERVNIFYNFVKVCLDLLLKSTSRNSFWFDFVLLVVINTFFCSHSKRRTAVQLTLQIKTFWLRPNGWMWRPWVLWSWASCFLMKTFVNRSRSTNVTSSGYVSSVVCACARVTQTQALMSQMHGFLFSQFCHNNKKAQKYLLGGFECLVKLHQSQLLPRVSIILKDLYDADLLEEDVILAWAEKVICPLKHLHCWHSNSHVFRMLINAHFWVMESMYSYKSYIFIVPKLANSVNVVMDVETFWLLVIR